MATLHYLQGVLRGLVKTRAQVVKRIDVRPHFVPLNLNSLKVSLHYLSSSELNSFFDKLNSYLNQRYPNPLTVTSLKGYFQNNKVVEPEDIISKLPLRLVNTAGTTIGMLFKDYRSTQESLFRDFLNKEMTDYVNKASYETSKRSKGFDVGHTFIKSDSKFSNLADSPLSLQVAPIVEIINALSTKGPGAEFERELKKEGLIKKSGFRVGALQQEKLSNVQNELTAYFSHFTSKHSYGQKVTVYLSKDIKGLLVDVRANIVLIQDREENQGEFARVEASLREEVLKILPKIHFSKSAEEEIKDRVAQMILFGKVKSPNVKVKKQVSSDNRTNKVVNPGARVSSAKLTLKAPRLRNVQGRFTSITNIEALIRASLTEAIRKNMAEPALVNRTGRFAESVKLNYVSTDRLGNLSAFLTYMKYPYATFEPGGAQGSIDRSPRILIDRSVREIAVGLTTTRLKTIIV